MTIHPHSTIPVCTLPGIVHQTLASAAQGFPGEVWNQTMEPGARTPPHYHEVDEIVCVLAGSGEVILDGETRTFAAESTMVVPARVVHQIVNTGTELMRTMAFMPETPARVFTPDGQRLPLPWEADPA